MDKLFYKITKKTSNKEFINISHNPNIQHRGNSVNVSYNINNNNGSSIVISNKNCYNKYMIQEEMKEKEYKLMKNRSNKKIMKNPSITSLSYIENKEEIIKYK